MTGLFAGTASLLLAARDGFSFAELKTGAALQAVTALIGGILGGGDLDWLATLINYVDYAELLRWLPVLLGFFLWRWRTDPKADSSPTPAAAQRRAARPVGNGSKFKGTCHEGGGRETLAREGRSCLKSSAAS